MEQPSVVVRSVLVVDDDLGLLATYKRGLELRAVPTVIVSSSVASARPIVDAQRLDAAIIDLRVGRECGISLIPALRAANSAVRIIVVSGYLTTDMVVAAMRAGAHDVLPKPVTIREIMARVHRAFGDGADPATPTLDQAIWQHMHRVLADCGGNRSETARKLGVDRGTLQRWIERTAPR